MKYLRLALTLFLLCLSTSAAFAEEKILSFDVDVFVSKNGDFVVTENIKVWAEGDEIKRGIFRDIPQFLMDGEYIIPQRMTVFSVNRDGKRTPYKTIDDGNVLKIRIGEESVFLNRDAYAYEIIHTSSKIRCVISMTMMKSTGMRPAHIGRSR